MREIEREREREREIDERESRESGKGQYLVQLLVLEESMEYQFDNSLGSPFVGWQFCRDS